MSLFNFELVPLVEVVPWGNEDARSLNWYALSEGVFHMRMGEHSLFEYSPKMQSEFEIKFAEYQVAAFVRDIVSTFAAALAPLPDFFERLARRHNIQELKQSVWGNDDSDEGYEAFRWLEERSPFASYLVATPEFSFVRLGDEVQVCWNNTQEIIAGSPTWTAGKGSCTLSAETFEKECRDFCDRLMSQMGERLDAIEGGSQTQVPVDVSALRVQHQTFCDEFAAFFTRARPEAKWGIAEQSIRRQAKEAGIELGL